MFDLPFVTASSTSALHCQHHLGSFLVAFHCVERCAVSTLSLNALSLSILLLISVRAGVPTNLKYCLLARRSMTN